VIVSISREIVFISRVIVSISRVIVSISREIVFISREIVSNTYEPETFSHTTEPVLRRDFLFLCTETAFWDKLLAAPNATGRQFMAAGRLVGDSIEVLLFKMEVLIEEVLLGLMMYLSVRVMSFSERTLYFSVHRAYFAVLSVVGLRAKVAVCT
jgi:hypothetical protein